jgi:hypothetical protein
MRCSDIFAAPFFAEMDWGSASSVFGDWSRGGVQHLLQRRDWNTAEMSF